MRRSLIAALVVALAALAVPAAGTSLAKPATKQAPERGTASDVRQVPADVQAKDPASTLSLYRLLLVQRRLHALGSGALTWLDGLGKDVVAFRNGNVTVVANLGSTSVPLPEGIVIAASGPVAGRELPVDTTVWLAVD